MTPTLTPTAAATSTVAPTAQALPDDCPTSLDAYADAVLDQLNDEATTPEDLQTWLVACRAATADEQSVTVASLAQGQEAAIVVLHDPTAEVIAPQGLVLVYHKTAQDYTLSHKYESMGRVELVLASDINGDDNFDLVYSDFSCGAHTCFGTLRVESWDGEAYQDWIEGEPTIAGPEYQLENVTAEGEGDEILVHGGVIDSAGAGPQRAWTEVYISPEGGAYVLLSREYDPSPCLYHRILDANAAFDQWAHEGFDQAIESYEAAIADEEAEACGAIDDEVEKLQDFARFRLLVAHVAAGSAAQGIELAGEITQPDVQAVAEAFLTSYRVSGSVIQACRDTTSFGEAEPSSWEFLADWGYANPSFTAFDLCPVN